MIQHSDSRVGRERSDLLETSAALRQAPRIDEHEVSAGPYFLGYQNDVIGERCDDRKARGKRGSLKRAGAQRQYCHRGGAKGALIVRSNKLRVREAESVLIDLMPPVCNMSAGAESVVCFEPLTRL